MGSVRQRAERAHHGDQRNQVTGQEHEGAWHRDPAISYRPTLRPLCRNVACQALRGWRLDAPDVSLPTWRSKSRSRMSFHTQPAPEKTSEIEIRNSRKWTYYKFEVSVYAVQISADSDNYLWSRDVPTSP